MAAVFAVVLAVVGLWASKKRPRKGVKHRTVVKAFKITSMPFIFAEAGTGIVSFLTGHLSIPPLDGAAMAVDMALLLSGLSIAILWQSRKRANESGQ